MNVLLAVVLIVSIVLHLVIANKFSSIAEEKGYYGYFGWCFFLGIAGWLMVVALPNKHDIVTLNEIQLEKIIQSLRTSSTPTTIALSNPKQDDTLPNL